jgi:hypothetical protein
MKNIIKYILKAVFLLIMMFIYPSCIDLEEDTSSVLSIDELTNEASVLASLTPVYNRIQEAYFKPHHNSLLVYGADDITTWWAGNKAPMRVFDRFDFGSGENSDIFWLDIGWDAYWQTIYYANTIIEGLKTATAPEQIVKIADGEARFLRAMAYYQLVRTFGNMPIILDGYTPTGDEVRATVLENYGHISADLLIAEASLPLPGEVDAPGRASAGAAKALLADVYLTWAGWPVKDVSKLQLAASKAKEVIDMGYYELLPIEDLWLFESQNSKESVFSVQFSETEDMNNGWPSATSGHESRGWSDVYPELTFFYEFPEGPRKDATFRTDIPQRGYADGKIFERDPPTLPWQESQRMHPMYQKYSMSEVLDVRARVEGYRALEVIRYAEVLLIYAEAQARIGENASSIEALNQVKRRAMGYPFDGPEASVDVATATVDEILDEKGWELACEVKRWFDLTRSETLEDATAKRDTAENVELFRMPTKANYIAPIPHESVATSKLLQNPEGFIIQ